MCGLPGMTGRGWLGGCAMSEHRMGRVVGVGDEPTGVRKQRIARLAFGPAEKTLAEIRNTLTYIATVITVLALVVLGAAAFAAYEVYTSVDALRGTDIGR